MEIAKTLYIYVTNTPDAIVKPDRAHLAFETCLYEIEGWQLVETREVTVTVDPIAMLPTALKRLDKVQKETEEEYYKKIAVIDEMRQKLRALPAPSMEPDAAVDFERDGDE